VQFQARQQQAVDRLGSSSPPVLSCTLPRVCTVSKVWRGHGQTLAKGVRGRAIHGAKGKFRRNAIDRQPSRQTPKPPSNRSPPRFSVDISQSDSQFRRGPPALTTPPVTIRRKGVGE
jgi:hypothetical protein